jgi:hypothetical protein
MYNKRVLYPLQPHNGRKKGARRQALGVFCKTYLTKALFLRRFSRIVLLFLAKYLTFFFLKRYHKDRIKNYFGFGTELKAT